MLIRLEWKENRSPAWRASSAGTSVSTVMLELGTTSPMRWGGIGFLLRLRGGWRAGWGRVGGEFGSDLRSDAGLQAFLVRLPDQGAGHLGEMLDALGPFELGHLQ